MFLPLSHSKNTQWQIFNAAGDTLIKKCFGKLFKHTVESCMKHCTTELKNNEYIPILTHENIRDSSPLTSQSGTPRQKINSRLKVCFQMVSEKTY